MMETTFIKTGNTSETVHKEETVSKEKKRNSSGKKRRRKSMRFYIGTGMAVTALFIAVLAAVITVVPYNDNDSLQLILKTSSIQLSCFQKFQPENYIQTLEKSEGALLKLPEMIDTSKPQEYVVKYVLSKGNVSIERLLRVCVRDNEEPKLELTKEEVEIYDTNAFSCRAYIALASDRVDGNLTENVTCSSTLTEQEYQEVIYTLKDNAGNVTEKTLKIHVFQANHVLEEQMNNGESSSTLEEENAA